MSNSRFARRIALCATALIVSQLPFILLLIIQDNLLTNDAKWMLWSGLAAQLLLAIFMMRWSDQLSSGTSSTLGQRKSSWRSDLSS